jgi:hypothetical protein
MDKAENKRNEAAKKRAEALKEKAKAKILLFYAGKAIPEREKEFWCKQLTRVQPKDSACPLP